jgi:hypothetical protein
MYQLIMFEITGPYYDNILSYIILGMVIDYHVSCDILNIVDWPKNGKSHNMVSIGGIMGIFHQSFAPLFLGF